MTRRAVRQSAFSLVTILACCLIPAAAAARSSTCPELIKPQPSPTATIASSASNGQLTALAGDGNPASKATLVMDYGTNRGRDIRTQTYRLSPGLDPNTVHLSLVNDINSENDPLPIGNRQLTYRVGVDHATGFVNVRVCYDPGAEHEPAAGRYTGSLLVSAPGAKPVPLALEFTFQDKGLLGVVLFALLGVLAGVVIQAFAAFQQAPTETRPKKIWPYLFNFRTLLAAGTGAVAGLTAYGKIESNPIWHSTMTTLLEIGGATLAATLAGKTLIDLKGPTEKEKDRGVAS
jgi:hypothetical protein